MSRTVFADYRFIGEHGIGRFAREVLSRIGADRLNIAGSPTSPLCTLYTAAAIARALPADGVFFSPSYIPPIWSRKPYVFTVHDLNHVDRPENSNFLKRLFYRFILRRGCRRAEKVLTVSDFSRRRIIDWSGVDPSRVVNVGNGVDSAYSPNALRYDPGYSYLLAVSNRKAHKNDVGVLKAFAGADLPASLHLIFTGAATAELLQIARESAIDERVHFVGKLPDAVLPSIYAGALALVFPSFYEGFGLPVIEAMACGTPVITSNSTSLPEVAGGAALLVNPSSVDDISAAIKRVVAEPDLRATLRKKGIARARHFNWDAVAQRVSRAICEDSHKTGDCGNTIIRALRNGGQKK